MLSDLLSREQILMRLSQAIMRILRTDSLAMARLSELEGRIIALRVTGLEFEIFAAVDGDGLLLARSAPREADVALAGRLADFAAFAGARADREAMPAGRLRIQGDLATAQAVQRLLDELALDWEALLAEQVGEVAARQIGRAVSSGVAFLRALGDAFRRDFPAWLQDEQAVVPSAEEVETFTRQSMTLGSDVDRLAARISRLQGRRS